MRWHPRLERAWRHGCVAAALLALGGSCALAASPPVPLSATAAPATDGLAPALRQWLQARQPVRFGAERDYGPFVFQRADGQLDGLSIDMLRLVQAHTGLVLVEQPAMALRELLVLARARQVDLLSSLRPTPERAQYLRFSQPYVVVPAVLVRRGGDPVRGLAELGGVPVAVGDGYAVQEVMHQRHPAVHWMAMSDDGAALDALLRGEVQAAVADAASVAFLVRTRGLQGLRVDAPVGFDYSLSFAVRSDWPELVDILNQGIQRLGQRERQRVIERWLATTPATPAPPPVTRAAQGGLLLLVLAAVAGGLWWWRGRAVARAHRRDGRG